MPKNFFLFSILFVSFWVNSISLSAQTDSSSTKHKKHVRKWLANLTDTTGEQHQADAIVYYDNYIYKKNIKTVQLYDSSYKLSSPIIQLGTNQQLKLSFDDLEGGLKTYNYTLIHCNSSWEPSDLAQADYSSGFPSDVITEHQSSLNTIQPYTHYNQQFPNENIRLTKSGNYIVKVYQDNDPNKLVLSRRFFVYDQKIGIDAVIKPATNTMYRNYKQEIDFTINYVGYEIENPYADLKVVIMQNGRWDNAISNLKPKFVKDDILSYDYDEENVFTGGNEFRNFDLKSMRYQTEHIQKITYDSLKNHVYLTPDEKRPFKRYTSGEDINGRYLIKMNEATNSEREADYTYVHFFLPYELITDGSLYIMGALSDWQFTDTFKMEYDPKRMGFVKSVYLKQGYYNYEYVFLKDKQTVGDETYIEGMHFETENEYTIYVYFHAPGTSYDQLIGIRQVNSQTAKRN